ncbi:hypothetical protein LTR50_007475 [Elasticomyces elasticus]|nr:hypothetical protein LTR50_007475 [Elasticomyces elasticus]
MAAVHPDVARARELHKYYYPEPLKVPSTTSNRLVTDPSSFLGDATASQASLTNIALAAYAQLVALYLSAERATISLVDCDSQYFVAESTKILKPGSKSEAGDSEGGLWLPVAEKSTIDSLCERTMALPSIVSGHSCLVVPDLSTDPRFNRLPYVLSPPSLRFYAGVPLTTINGINIGTLFVTHFEPRTGLAPRQERFLGQMAQVVMRHLETNREARERRRETEMIRGLAAFVEGKVSSRSRNAPKPRQFKPTNSKRIEKHASEGSLRNVGCENGSLDNTSSSQSHMQVVPPLIPVKDRHSLYSGINTPENPNSDEPGGLADTSDAKTLVAENRDTKLLADGSKSTPLPHQRITGHDETFARAADLLDETLQLDGAGGVVYFDAADGLHLNVLDNDDPPTYRKESSFHDKQSESDFVFGSPSQCTNIEGIIPQSRRLSSTSVYREQDGSIDCLRQRAERNTIALFGFDSDGKGSQRSSLIRESLATYITEWFGLSEVSTWSSSSPADILIADEVNLPALLAHGPKFPGSAAGPLLVILCSNATRYGQTTVYAEGGGVIEFVLKPVGPYKLARALNLCLERAGEAKRNSSSYRHVSEVSSVGPPKVGTAIDNPCEATTGLQDGTSPSTTTRARDDVPVGEGGDDVPSATYISPVNTTDPPKLDPAGFPLPSSRPSEDGRGAEGSSSDLRQSRQSAASVELLLSDVETKKSGSPRVLIVDDNKINLRLLKTFMNKSGCHAVDSAEDGSLAVDAVEKSEGYDIIFMDMSMPILNGFEATRAIREIEKGRCRDARGTLYPPPAYIIAFTGLASLRSQSEAYACGVDSYMTKPTSFRDVGKLLKEWKWGGRAALCGSDVVGSNGG